LTQLIFIHKDVQIRSSFYETGKKLGFSVSTANLYEEVVELLKKIHPEFVIIDPEFNQIPTSTLISQIRKINPLIQLVMYPQNCLSARHMRKFFEFLNERKKVRGHILIVDDDRICADMETNFLKISGMTVESAYSGEEALSKIRQKRPDIILLDVCMPGMDGEVTLKKIREIDQEVPVIMTTAICQDSTVKEIIKLGVSGYLLKPFSLDKLQETILKHLFAARPLEYSQVNSQAWC